MTSRNKKLKLLMWVEQLVEIVRVNKKQVGGFEMVVLVGMVVNIVVA